MDNKTTSSVVLARKVGQLQNKKRRLEEQLSLVNKELEDLGITSSKWKYEGGLAIITEEERIALEEIIYGNKETTTKVKRKETRKR